MHYCPRRLADDRCARRLAAASPQALTHRPRASGPHDFSVRGRLCRIIRGLRVLAHDDQPNRCDCAVSYRVAQDSRVPPCLTRCAPALPRPSPPGPHLVTVANAPLAGPGWAVYATNPKFGKVKYFCRKGLTVFCPTGRPAWTAGDKRARGKSPATSSLRAQRSNPESFLSGISGLLRCARNDEARAADTYPSPSS